MAKVDFVVVIPARYGSSRLPGKPLADICGKSMIERVYQQAQQSDAKDVVIATDDARVLELVQSFGGKACMTSAEHESGTDRLAEVAALYQWPDDAIVVNVQGDEPLIPPQVINQVAELMASHEQADITTLAEPLQHWDEVMNPNIVKVLSRHDQRALYFSRAPIPWDRDGFAQSNKQLQAGVYRRHIGIYAYRVHLLKRFVQWPAAQLEQIEKLEQLRAMEQGAYIYIADACAEVPGGVDTESDLEHVRQLLSS